MEAPSNETQSVLLLVEDREIASEPDSSDSRSEPTFLEERSDPRSRKYPVLEPLDLFESNAGAAEVSDTPELELARVQAEERELPEELLSELSVFLKVCAILTGILTFPKEVKSVLILKAADFTFKIWRL